MCRARVFQRFTWVFSFGLEAKTEARLIHSTSSEMEKKRYKKCWSWIKCKNLLPHNMYMCIHICIHIYATVQPWFSSWRKCKHAFKLLILSAFTHCMHHLSFFSNNTCCWETQIMTFSTVDGVVVKDTAIRTGWCICSKCESFEHSTLILKIKRSRTVVFAFRVKTLTSISNLKIRFYVRIIITGKKKTHPAWKRPLCSINSCVLTK